MKLFEHYPYPLIIEFCLIAFSLLLYTVDLILIIATSSYKVFAIRLFLYFLIAQCFILVPQLIIPFFSNPHGTPSQKEIIEDRDCDIQAASINFGWCMASLVSLLMLRCVSKALNGDNPRPFLETELKWVISILLISMLPSVFFWSFHIFQVHDWHYYSRDEQLDVYAYCQLELSRFSAVILISEDVFYIATAIFLQIQVRIRKAKLRERGISISNPILYIHWFSYVQGFFWTVNGIAKALDAASYYQGRGIGPLWVLINLMYYSEAIPVTYMFLLFFLPILKPRMPPQFYRILYQMTYCKRKPKYLDYEDTITGSINESLTEDHFSNTACVSPENLVWEPKNNKE